MGDLGTWLSSGDVLRTPADHAFDLRAEEGAGALLACDPLLPLLCDALEEELVHPRRIDASRAGVFARLPEQYRSVTVALRSFDAAAGGVLVLKGLEPLMEDYGELLEWMRHTALRVGPREAYMPAVDHFPLKENKVPGALALAEALREARKALEIQSAHVEHYGELAALPVPLYVHRHSASCLDSVRAALEPRLAAASLERLRPLLDDGLAAYAYYYPGFPARVWTEARPRPGESETERSRRLAEGGAEAAIRGWVRLSTRLFYLGLLPYTYQNERLGACFDQGNACMDGGMVDVDSIAPMAEVDDDGAFHDAVATCLAGIEQTAARLLPEACHPKTAERFVRQYLGRLFLEAIESEARTGLTLDERVRAFFEPPTFEGLTHLLGSRKRHTHDYFEGSSEGPASEAR